MASGAEGSKIDKIDDVKNSPRGSRDGVEYWVAANPWGLYVNVKGEIWGPWRLWLQS